MNGACADYAGAPPEIERCIRARGAVIDLAHTQSIYGSLLNAQRRDGVLIQRDAVYGIDPRHRVDIYRPEKDPGNQHAAILFLHGGGFIRGDKSEKENIGLYFARRGFVVAIANYRLAPKHVWPAGAEDAAAAYGWLAANVAMYGGNPDHIFLMGESAGAAHVATATLVSRFRPPRPTIAGIVLVSGVYDAELELRARRQLGLATPDPRNEPYFCTDFARYREMSTIRLIDVSPIPVLVSYAELDPPQMQVQAGALFTSLVIDHGFDPDLQVVRGHNHLTQVYAVNTGDESLTHGICTFLQRHKQ